MSFGAEPLFTIFEIDGEEYISDQRSILTSLPPQYNCYRLSDGVQKSFYCAEVAFGFTRYAKPEEIQKRIQLKRVFIKREE